MPTVLVGLYEAPDRPNNAIEYAIIDFRPHPSFIGTYLSLRLFHILFYAMGVSML